MVVGALVEKFMWLLDEVEVKGTVRRGSASDGKDVFEAAHELIDQDNSTDWFDVFPDPNYAHLITGGSSGRVHLETYIIDFAQINRDESFGPGTKPEDPFQVLDPTTGAKRNLRVGDHVRVVGRWVIDHHPEGCLTRVRGWLRVGCCHVEFHPFHWDDMALVKTLDPGERQVETVSLAAPLWEEVYHGGGKWLGNELAGVASKVFIADDGSNFRSTVRADAHIKAPPLPIGFSGLGSLVAFEETVLKNGTGLGISQVRSVSVESDGIWVQAVVSSPATQRYDHLLVGDVRDPGNDKSVFQARYSVWWRRRLLATDSAGHSLHPAEDQGPSLVTLAPQVAGSTSTFTVYLQNRGPDPITMTSATIENDTEGAFRLPPASGVKVSAGYAVDLNGQYIPVRSGSFSASIVVLSNDPGHERLEIPLLADATAAPSRPKAEVDPVSIDFGAVPVGTIASSNLTVRNVGAANAYVVEVTKSSTSRLRPMSLQPLTVGTVEFERPMVPVVAPGAEDQFQLPAYIPTQAIGPGQSQSIPIAYAPTVTGPAFASAAIVADDGVGPVPAYRETLNVELQGLGVAARVVITPDPLDFGVLAPGDFKDVALEIANTGTSALTVAGISGDWMNGSFVLDQSLTFPLPSIPSGGRTSVTVRFNAPSTPGQRLVTRWEVMTQPSSSPPVTFDVVGMSAGPRIEVFPDFVDFGRVQQVPAKVDVVIRNIGTSDLGVRSARLQTGTEFQVVAGAVRSLVIPAANEHRVTLEFNAQAAGQYSDTLIVSSQDPTRPRVTNMIQAVLL